MSANIQDILKEKFANVDVEQVSAQINEEIKKIYRKYGKQITNRYDYGWRCTN